MKLINFDETPSLVSRYMLEMRDVNMQSDRLRFRRNLERVGQIMAYEISKTLEYKHVTVDTPLAPARCTDIADKVVLGTIFRAGLPFHLGFLNYFDYAGNAFVSAYRRYLDKGSDEFDIHVEYLASPRLEDKTLILCDPMLATGLSMELCYRALLAKGKPQKVHLASVIASQKAVDYIAKVFPDDTTLWVGAIDPDLNPHKYIVPGLGDAGDLAFGIKE